MQSLINNSAAHYDNLKSRSQPVLTEGIQKNLKVFERPDKTIALNEIKNKAEQPSAKFGDNFLSSLNLSAYSQSEDNRVDDDVSQVHKRKKVNWVAEEMSDSPFHLCSKNNEIIKIEVSYYD